MSSRPRGQVPAAGRGTPVSAAVGFTTAHPGARGLHLNERNRAGHRHQTDLWHGTSLLPSGLAGWLSIGAREVDARRLQCLGGGEIRVLQRRVEMPVGKLDLITRSIRVLWVDRPGHAWQSIRYADPYLRLNVGVGDRNDVGDGVANEVRLADDEGGC